MIANQFADADPGLFTASLLALGFILFVITFIVLAAARFMLSRLAAEGLRRWRLSIPGAGAATSFGPASPMRRPPSA